MSFDFNAVGGWLDLTTQEFEILKSIYRLQLSKKTASPTEINRAYAQESGKTIQKQNLHKILRRLLDAGFVERRGQGDYRATLDGVRESLERKRDAKTTELSSFTRLLADLEGEFNKHLRPSGTPHVEYLEAPALYAHITAALGKASEFNVVANFPSIAYPPNLSAKLGRSEYSHILTERCLGKGSLQTNFLTDLDVDYLFVHCFRVLDSPAKAFKLAINVLANLESLIESADTVDIRYHPDPHGLDVAVPVADEPSGFYLFTRDEHQEISGGIYVRNPNSTRNALQSFRRNFDYAETNLTRHLEEARTKLTQKYGILGK